MTLADRIFVILSYAVLIGSAIFTVVLVFSALQ